MITDRLREVCAELVEALDAELDLFETRHSDLIDRASALLAETQPVSPPTDEELIAAAAQSDFLYERDGCLYNAIQEDYHVTREVLAFARAVLARWGRPAPVPVSLAERPWEREGWCDAEGKCWLFGKIEGDWRLLSPTNSGVPKLSYCFSHALPHWALPVPQEEADYNHNS